jgi:serine/threonine-protein kinase
VHRDFTPDNLILRKDGTLKLVDFNVAQQKESTATGTVVGKHAYLPPEQFRGQTTTQSDIYSLGASLFFILTGEEPEPISQQEVQRLKPEVSDRLAQAIKKATAIELGDRYLQAADLERDLSVAGVH